MSVILLQNIFKKIIYLFIIADSTLCLMKIVENCAEKIEKLQNNNNCQSFLSLLAIEKSHNSQQQQVCKLII